MKFTNKQSKIIAGTIAIWGIILIGSGVTMTLTEKPKTESKVKLKVTQKRISSSKSNEIKLKDIESQINEPISVNVKDYLENPQDIEEKIIKTLKLDTAMININEAGTYTYTITYKKKKFNGTYIIKAKELPNITITLKEISLELGSTLPTDIQSYISETLTDEIRPNITLDLSSVNTSQSGNYQYKVTYNNKLYTGTITIYEPKIIKNEPEKKNTTIIKEQENGSASETKTEETEENKEEKPIQ